MSWVERSVEERLANAAAAGELDTPELNGMPLDLDSHRGQGWWADQFTRRELSHDRRKVAEEAAESAQVAFWRSGDRAELLGLVRDANDAIGRANINLVDADRLPPFDPADIERRWRQLRGTA